MRPLFALLLFALPAFAAPVPKALKAKPTADGVWEWVEFNGNDGKMQYAIQKPMYWRIEGDGISTGMKSVEELLAKPLTHTMKVRDEKQPHLRTFDTGVKYSAVMELDGDTLRWCYANDQNKTITECKPADGVYYYVFKRVAEK
jgi:hypothetical protein